MFKYIKGDPIRIFAFAVSLIIGIFIIRGFIIKHNDNVDGLRNTFCDGFIQATEEDLSVSLNTPIALKPEHKDEIKGIFQRSISVKNLMEIADSEEKQDEIQKSEDYIRIMTGMMSDDDKLLYEDICLSYTENAQKEAVSENMISQNPPH